MTRDFQQYGKCDQQRLRPACAYAQSDQSLCLSLEYSMTVKLLTEHYLEFLSLSGGCTDSSVSTHVKMPHCWKSRHGSYIQMHFRLLLMMVANTMNPDQTSPNGSILSGSIIFTIKAIKVIKQLTADNNCRKWWENSKNIFTCKWLKQHLRQDI